MAFQWKEHNRIWEGEGIYHLTFSVSGRHPLLGRLAPLGATTPPPGVASMSQPASTASGAASMSQPATMPPSDASTPQSNASRPYIQDVERPFDTNGSVATRNAASVNGTPKHTTAKAIVHLTPLGYTLSDHLQHISDFAPGVQLCAKQVMPDHVHVILWIKQDTGRSIRQIGNGIRIGIKKAAISLGVWNGAQGHVLDIPFIRTLSHKGQLRKMIDYVHANPDSAWERHQTPEFYTIHRNITRSDLRFDAMGKTRLLDYPDRHVVALSRSLTSEQIEAEVRKALRKAEMGCVTYTAAINAGERAVSKAIRQAGYPLVVMMLDGFPAAGTEAARYFHPSGTYHTACGEGKLLLLAPQQSNYNNPALIGATEEELQRKFLSHPYSKDVPRPIYHSIPHTSKRWLMIAGNMMLRMIAETYPPPPCPLLID